MRDIIGALPSGGQMFLTWKTMDDLHLESVDLPGNLPPSKREPGVGSTGVEGPQGRHTARAIQITDPTGRHGHSVVLFAGDKGFDRKVVFSAFFVVVVFSM